MSHIAAAAGPVQDILHPRVTRRDLPDGRIVYVKWAWTGADGEALLRREADLQRAASARQGPYGVLAVPPTLVEGDRPELRSDAIVHEVPFGDEAARNEVTAEVLAAGFRIGRQLRALHGSAVVPERATPETPVLIPVRIERLSAVPDSTITLLASLPSWVSRRAGAWAGKEVLGPGFIHGDFKPDNVFVSADSVTFIDWERAGSGEKAHDLASFIAGMLSLRLGSIGTAGTGDRGRAREV
ncbi:phosphotransferase family protein, partial [Actinomadura adrarensis]